MDIYHKVLLCDLSKRPEIIQTGLSLHGYKAVESFRMNSSVYGLHVYMYSGSLKFDDGIHLFNDHSISITPPEKTIEWSFPENAPHYYIHFKLPTCIESGDRGSVLPVITESFDLHKEFCNEIEQISQLYPEDRFECEIRVWALLMKIAQFRKIDRKAPYSCHPSVQIAKSIIENSVSEKLSVADIASKVGISPDHLSLLFRKNTGMTVKQFCTKVKCEKAYYLLTHSSMSIVSIAKEIGYQDLQQFNKLMHRSFGYSPRAIRTGAS